MAVKLGLITKKSIQIIIDELKNQLLNGIITLILLSIVMVILRMSLVILVVLF